MLYRNTFIADTNLKTQEQNYRTTPPQRVSIDHGAITEAVVSDSHSWATSVLVITSAVNGLGNITPEKLANQVRNLVPHEAGIIYVLENGLADVVFSEATRLGLIEAFHELSIGADLVTDYVNDAEHLDILQAQILHRSILKRHWRSLCGQMIQLIDDVMSEVNKSVAKVYRENWKSLKPLLQKEKLGESSYLTSDGDFISPALPQRRRDTRVSILQSCQVDYHGRSYKAFARDISTGGLGIERGLSIPVGERVEVTLAHGRSLKGRIVWANEAAGSFGLLFDAPLQRNDPILFG